jgi:hypothetical protein
MMRRDRGGDRLGEFDLTSLQRPRIKGGILCDGRMAAPQGNGVDRRGGP